TAVDDISFDVKKGEIFGFLGPNGAGKTTTINMLCTLLLPTSGRATVSGFDIVTQTDDVRSCIGLVFQEPTLDEYLTAEENLLFHSYAYGIPHNERKERLEAMLQMVELWDRRKDRIQTYSGGMRRRLEIARGLLHRPEILFLDEPTIGLDPQTRRKICDYIHELQKQTNLTIFLTTQYMDEAENCDRISIIDHGKIIALDTPDKLKDALGGDIITIQTNDNEAAVKEIQERYGLLPSNENGSISFSVSNGAMFLPEFVRTSSMQLTSVNLRRPTLDDVFLKLTGSSIRADKAAPSSFMRMRMRRMG
ncbi:MAG TPA: ATP-binding cassette domain-containing protein, partial [Bacteroidota bacterium]|nr:ATP-binding cassette domain-containing protein [Bacteroidota bacterium]